MQHNLKDFGLVMKGSPLYYDGTSAISITKKHVLHPRTKYIEVKYHFIRANVKEGIKIYNICPWMNN